MSLNHSTTLPTAVGFTVAVKLVLNNGVKAVNGAAAILIVGIVLIVTVTLVPHPVVLHVPSARTKYVVVVFTGMVILAPVPTNVPPQLALYHLQLAPVPKAPPTTVKVVEVGPQLATTLLVAPVGATELPLTVIVTVVATPIQPAAVFGVTVIVAVTAVGVMLIAVKLGMLPVPLDAKPILGVLLVQLNVVPATVLVKFIAAVDDPVHSVWFGTTPTVAVGFTVMVNVLATPAQPVLVTTGVTVIVAVTGALVVLTAVNTGILPVPVAAKPILGVVLVQLKVVPATVPVKVTADVAPPLHTTWLTGWFTDGVGYIVSIAIIDGPLQPLMLGVIVNVTTTGVFTVVVKVPEILPVPLAAIPVAATTLSLVQLYTVPATKPVRFIVAIGAPEHDTCVAGVAAAVGVGWMVTVAVTGVPTHPAKVGVIVNVTVMGAKVVLIIKPVIVLPLPLAGIPPGAVVLVVLFLVQVNVVPGVPLVKTIGVMATPLHIVCAAGVAIAFGIGFTNTVAVIAGPAQPLAVGIMVKVTVTGKAVVFVNVPAIELPVPLAAMPVTATVLSLVQLYTTPATALPVITIVVIGVAEHRVCEDGVATAVGVGFTNTVEVIGVPAQPLAVGVMVKVTVTGAVVVLVSVPLISPAPLAAMPVVATVLSLVQLYTTPATALPVMAMVVIATPEHTVCVDGVATAVDVGFTNTVEVRVPNGLEQPLALSGVIVNVTVTGDVVVLVKVPLISPVPLAAIPVAATVLSLVQL